MSTQLEITLRRGYSVGYEVELRLARSGDQGDVYTRGSLRPEFDPATLPPVGDGVAYGVTVGQALLYDPRVRRAFDEATVAAGNDPLRVRFHVHPDAAALYRVAWEAARDEPHPGEDPPLLFAGERRIFSRYITSSDARPLYRRRPGDDLRVLMAVANPSNIGKYSVGGIQLPPIDEHLETDRLTQALGGHAISKVLQSSKEAVTLDVLIEHLAEDYDVLVLVCHGALQPSGPVLYLQAGDGSAEGTEGEEFVRRVAELRTRPRLVFLASCQSAGTAADQAAPLYGAGGALAPLGPRLADAGIPAVIAMQGNVAIDTINDFMPVFFRFLAQDGCVDRAVSLARSQLREKHRDWWVPSLIMRLRTGELFRRTGFEGGQTDFQYWNELTAAIANRKCTPILGPALLEQHVGSRRELASRLARAYKMPAPRAERDVLALVAQQLAAMRGVDGVRRELLLVLMDMVRDRYRGLLTAELETVLPKNVAPDVLLTRMRDMLAFASERQGRLEAHAILARLPFSLYLSANPDGLMERALERERPGTAPVSEILRWHPEQDAIPSVYAAEARYTSSLERPLVYHFFGSATHQESIVVSQDHFLDALIAASRKDAVPAEVRSALSSRTLLFLGFQPDDWSFRALFRFILKQEGAGLLRTKVHFAVQIDPEENEFDEPEVARRYLAQYLRSEQISIYWGSAGDFLAELEQQYGPATGGR